MDNEKAIAEVKEFCEAEYIDPANWITKQVSGHVLIRDVLVKFLQSMIEKEEVFEASEHKILISKLNGKTNYVETLITDNKSLSEILAARDVQIIDLTLQLNQDKSTVSSAGKEVTDEDIIKIFDMYSEEEGYVNWTQVLRNFDLSPKQVNDILFNSVRSILKDQFKSSPASTEISEEKITDIFFEIAIIQDEYGNSVIRYEDFVKWYREQLNRSHEIM